jgi:hypothetical protein
VLDASHKRKSINPAVRSHRCDPRRLGNRRPHGYLLIRNEPIADARLFFGLRLILSFGAATLGASIPGFLNVGWSGGGLAVRAGGALALFVLTFVYTPDVMTAPGASRVQINQHSEGPLSPPIAGNKGTITIEGETRQRTNP